MHRLTSDNQQTNGRLKLSEHFFSDPESLKNRNKTITRFINYTLLNFRINFTILPTRAAWRSKMPVKKDTHAPWSPHGLMTLHRKMSYDYYSYQHHMSLTFVPVVFWSRRILAQNNTTSKWLGDLILHQLVREFWGYIIKAYVIIFKFNSIT